ncbi:hypothetical protein HMPREF1624_03925 [Sporothrix schenckii ATCC 58251]|uniref:Major facilitator superfamily (MFS) profile domain-containing protein n=1 Tax=Sporothrix schenckii (strain ATCC 58251 / de Perez 2211183) TaxID=1391915 RepID=U7Q1I0_SPOS1|nr:hypothetical protein HMPREF1624_03925 [Sporothrix schenckii ATCC 58251]
MALPHSNVVQEFPPEWNVALDTESETPRNNTSRVRDHDEQTATESIKAPSDNTSTEKPPLSRVDTSATLTDEEVPLEIVGSTNIYDGDGKIRLIPTPSPNPKDPLNLPNWRKYAAIGALCFFGSLSMCADFVVGGLLPVFLLEYSGVDPRPILKHADMKGNPSPMALIPPGVQPVSLYEVTLLSTLPSLTNCAASFLLVPLSLAIGRRPVLLVTAMFSWIGGFLAAYSQSLKEHLAARVIHGLGSATVEALLPLVMQDMVFIHQRNRAIAAIMACQGPMMTIFGMLSPYIAVEHSWRWIYLITSSVGVLAWVLLIAFVPETRVKRSKQELNGQQVWPVAPGEVRTALDYATYGKRTLRDDLTMFHVGFQWREAALQMLRALQTTYFPAMLLVICIDAVFFIIMQSIGQTISFALLAAGIPYELSGLTMLVGLVSSVVVYLFGGPLADKLTLKISRLRGKTNREPEFQLPNLIVPFISSMAGCIIFGCAVQFHWHIAITLLGNAMLMIGSLTAATVLKTFIIESYPQWPGPVLVNVNTLRTVISFGFSSHASSWVQQRGYLFVFGVYVAVLFVMAMFIPVFFVFGKKFRQWTSGRIAKEDGLTSTTFVGSSNDVSPKTPGSSGESSGESSVGSTTALNRPRLPRSTTIGSIDGTLSRTTTTVETMEPSDGVSDVGLGKSKVMASVTVKEEV